MQPSVLRLMPFPVGEKPNPPPTPGSVRFYLDSDKKIKGRAANGDDVELVPLPEGDSVAAVIHNQTSASNEWIINHNLGYKPSITLFTTGGSQFEAEVIHVSINQARVYTNLPIAGSARCV